MNHETITERLITAESIPLLHAGMYVIEVRLRRRDKTLGPWQLRAAFVQREDAYSVFGKWGQQNTSRVLHTATQQTEQKETNV